MLYIIFLVKVIINYILYMTYTYNVEINGDVNNSFIHSSIKKIYDNFEFIKSVENVYSFVFNSALTKEQQDNFIDLLKKCLLVVFDKEKE